MLCPHDVKRSIRKGQTRCIALAIVDEFGEANPVGQHCSSVAVLVSQVDAGDAAAEFPSKATGCPADAAAYIEHAFRGIDSRSLGELERCCTTANVELIDGGQVFRREPVQVLACLLECSEDETAQTGAGVVRLYALVDLRR